MLAESGASAAAAEAGTGTSAANAGGEAAAAEGGAAAGAAVLAVEALNDGECDCRDGAAWRVPTCFHRLATW